MEAEYQAGAGFVGQYLDERRFPACSAKLTLEMNIGFHRGESYEVTLLGQLETGPMEDSVVLSRPSLTTSYDYEVIASTLVTMDDIGAERVLHRIGLPRTPVIFAHGPRSGYYNEHHDRRYAEDLTPRCSGTRPVGSTAMRRTLRRAIK